MSSLVAVIYKNALVKFWKIVETSSHQLHAVGRFRIVIIVVYVYVYASRIFINIIRCSRRRAALQLLITKSTKRAFKKASEIDIFSHGVLRAKFLRNLWPCPRTTMFAAMLLVGSKNFHENILLRLIKLTVEANRLNL